MDPWMSSSALDRVGEHRTAPDWVARLWQADETKLLKVTDEGRFTTDVAGDRLHLVKPFVGYDPQRHYLLGLVDGDAVFVVRAVVDQPTHTLRECGARLTDTERDIAAAGVALTQWHLLDPRCPSCGSETRVEHGGLMRSCPQCGRQTFPRSDPAIIVAIRDPADRLLLAGNGSWGPTRRSVLAGFVEAGESVEQAVHREVAEEADLTITDLAYFGSQPWPTPRSLMLGFTARAESSDMCVDGEEVVVADWYSRGDLTGALSDGTLELPPESSIARRLIESWRTDGRHEPGR